MQLAAPDRSPRGGDAPASFRRADGAAVEWRIAEAPVPYEAAVAAMDDRVAAIADGRCGELIWLLEHPPLYTAGTSSQTSVGAAGLGFPLHRTGRGGQITYHGPGQRVAYAMLDLGHRRQDLRAFVGAIESWIIETLAAFNVRGERREDRVGVWVARPDKAPGSEGEPAEDKIAAIGIRVRRWVTLHGLSLNVEPDLSHYAGMVPCGISQRHLGVTSLADLGITATMDDVDRALRANFEGIFGPVHGEISSLAPRNPVPSASTGR